MPTKLKSKIPDGFKPMLSGKAPSDLSKLRFPVMASPKLDGIRCIMFGGVAYSRNLKPIPNAFVQQQLRSLPDGFDGELICGKPTAPDVWNVTQSGVMSEDGKPRFTFHVFDWHGFAAAYFNRFEGLRYWMVSNGTDFYRYVRHRTFGNADALASYEDEMVESGYEGIMVRDPAGTYKYGRSTAKEGGLLKLKRFDDAEAYVIGAVEQMHNGNEATKDELGRTKRSSHKANKTGKGVLGALVCTIPSDKDNPAHPDHHKTRPATVFEIGTGFDDHQRRGFWDQHRVGGLKGRMVKYRHQGFTPDGVPRFPVFIGFRSEIDA